MKDEYLFKMFYEFLKANGISGGFEQFQYYKDMFIDWLEEKSEAGRRYAELVYSMGIEGDNYSRRIAEFGKGIYDSATPRLRELVEVPPIAITPFASTLSRVPGIEVAEGRLVNIDNNVYVAYSTAEEYFEEPNCNDMFGNTIGTLMTQQPIEINDIGSYFSLLSDDKTIFLGANGNKSDKDREDNTSLIYQLYHQLGDVDFIKMYYESTTIDDSYVTALKIRPRENSYVKKLYR